MSSEYDFRLCLLPPPAWHVHVVVYHLRSDGTREYLEKSGGRYKGLGSYHQGSSVPSLNLLDTDSYV